MNIYENPLFCKLKKTVDGLIRRLRQTEKPGKNQAEEITEVHEQDLRNRGFLSYNTPRALLSALIFEVGKLFGLRGGSELRNVRRGQFDSKNLSPGLVKVTFHEDITKTNHAGLSGGAGSGIRGPHLEDPNQPFSLTSLLTVYTQRLPPDADLTKTFWFKPLKAARKDGVWYSKMPIGEKTLAAFVKELMSDAGCKGNFTNHSLRTTTVNRMIDAGLSDGEIMNRTGHRSLTTIAKYRRINEANAAAASSALTLGGKAGTISKEPAGSLSSPLSTSRPSSTRPSVKSSPTEKSCSSTSVPGFDLGISQLVTNEADLFDAEMLPDGETLDKIVASILRSTADKDTNTETQDRVDKDTNTETQDRSDKDTNTETQNRVDGITAHADKECNTKVSIPPSATVVYQVAGTNLFILCLLLD